MTLSLPRFIATCDAWPRLTVGSTLDSSPNWADGGNASKAGLLVPREVDGSVVVPLVSGPAGLAGPVFGPSDLLHLPAVVACLG